MLCETAATFQSAIVAVAKQPNINRGILVQDICPKCGLPLFNTEHSTRYHFLCLCELFRMSPQEYALHIAKNAFADRYAIDLNWENGRYMMTCRDTETGLRRIFTFKNILTISTTPFKRIANRNFDNILLKNHMGRFSFVNVDEKNEMINVQCNICENIFPVKRASTYIRKVKCPFCNH